MKRGKQSVYSTDSGTSIDDAYYKVHRDASLRVHGS